METEKWNELQACSKMAEVKRSDYLLILSLMQIYIRKEANGDVVLSMRSQQQSSWDKMWSALDNLDTVDFLTPEERRQELSVRDPFEGINL